MKKISMLATHWRVAIALAFLMCSASLPNVAATVQFQPTEEDLELGANILMTEKFTSPSSQSTSSYTAVAIKPSTSGTLYVAQAYASSVSYSACNMLFNTTTVETGSYTGDFVLPGIVLDAAPLYGSLKYELEANETYYYWSYMGLKASSSTVGSTVNSGLISAIKVSEFQFLWVPDGGIDIIPEDTEFQVKEGEYYYYTPSINNGFLTITSNEPLPTNEGSIPYSYFIYSNFSSLCGFGGSYNGEYIAATEENDGEYSYLFRDMNADKTYLIKSSVNATVKFEMAETVVVSLTDVSPAPQSPVISSNWQGEISVTFYPSAGSGAGNTYGTLTFVPQDQEVSTSVKITPSKSKNTYIFDILEYYQLAEPGTDLTLQIDGLQYLGFYLSQNDTDYDVTINGSYGDLTMVYPKPVFEAENPSWPMLYAYYAPNTAAGIVNLTFSEGIQSVDNTAILTFGNASSENAPEVEIPVSFKNNILTVNFTGIDFERVSGVDLSSYDYSTATINISGLTSISGQEYDGSGILTQTLNFSDTYYDNVAPQRYMTQKASIISPAAGSYLPYLEEFVIAWGEENPVSLLDTNTLATLQINEEPEVYVACEIDVEGYLVVNVSQWSTKDDENIYGTYTITLPAELVENNQNLMNEAQTLIYVFSDKTDGISSLEYEGHESIYNLQGIKMNVKDKSLLPSGIYIINGKKILK